MTKLILLDKLLQDVTPGEIPIVTCIIRPRGYHGAMYVCLNLKLWMPL